MKIFKSKRAISLVSSIFIFCMINAQSDYRPGYLIALQGDTVKGFIDFRGDIANARNCIFKKEINQEKVIYTADQIKSYRFINGKYYVSSNSLNYKFKTPVFVEYIIRGSVSIYYFRDDKDHYLISKDTTLMELEHNDIVAGMSGDDNLSYQKPQKFRGQLKYILRDQPSIFTKVEDVLCNTKDLISLTKDYQKLSCPSQECIQYEKKMGKDVNVKLGIFFSAGFSNLSTPPYNMYITDYDPTKSLDFKTSFTYEVGALINLYLNFIGEKKYSIQLFPAVDFVGYKSYVERPISPLLYSYKMDIKFTTIKVPLLFKYSFYSNSSVIMPFIKFGMGCAIYIDQKGTYEYRSAPITGGSSQATEYIEPLNTSTKSYKFYFVGGAGTDIKCGKSLLFVGVTYEYGPGSIIGYKYIADQFKGFRSELKFQMGFQF